MLFDVVVYYDITLTRFWCPQNNGSSKWVYYVNLITRLLNVL